MLRFHWNVYITYINRANSFRFFYFSDWQSPGWEANLPPRYSLDLDSPWDHDILTDRKAPLKKISSADDSASKTSSLSSFSISSGEKDRETRKHGPNEHSVAYIGHPCMQPYSRQISSSSAATSVSEYPSSDYLDTAANSRSTSTSESMLGDTEAGMLHEMQIRFRDREIHDRSNYPQYYIDGTQRYSGDIIGNPYGSYSNAKPGLQNRERNKQQKKHDLIVPDEEEEFPFAKHTFNKKPDKNKQLNSVNFVDRNYSKNSISSKSLMDQYHLLHGMPSKRLTNSSSSSSLFSSMTSNSFTEYSSPDDMNLGDSYDFDWQRAHQGSFSHSNMNFPRVHPMYLQNGGKMMPGLSPYPGAEFGASQISPSPIDNSTSKAEQILSSLGFGETQNLVPERFLRSWVSKMVQSQQKEREIQQQQLAMAYQPYFMYPESLYDDNDIPPSVSAQQSGANTPRWRHSLENIHTNHPPATRSLASHRRVFRRAHSLNPMLNDSARFGNTSVEDMANSEIDRDSEFGSIGALPVSKENSFDKLKKILQNRETLSKEIRRSTFSSNRQKSLPLFLETLTEEDEAKCRSRSPSIEKAVDNRERRPSQMKYFFQEEERRSCTASESEPENSRKSSLNEPRLSEVINNLKDSIAEMSEAESLSSNDTGQSGSDKINSPERRNKILQLPSIIVSERVDSENNSPKNVERASVLRPVSPHPENQPKAKEDIYSKDSLEIAEIMNTSDKGGSAQTFRPVLDSIPSPSSDTFKSVSIKRVDGSTIASPNSRFLKIVPDMDDKSLSPSSINSPLGLSPVTVIEMAKLDNQNDSLETEDSLPKASGSASKGSSKSLSVWKQCLSPVNSNKPTASLNSHSQIIDKTPKSLSLERRSYERETKAAFDIDSIDEIDDKICVEYKEKEIQTTDDTLPPIVNVSDISSVMHFFIRNLPLHGQNLFYLAQDRETQYEAPLMKPNESGDISNEDSDRLDSGIISNQSSNESGSRLSPLQVSNSCSSKVKCEMHVMPGSIGVGNNFLNAVDSSLSFLHDRNKIGDFNEHDIDKNKQDNTKETVYRTEALIEIGTYDLKNSFQLAKQSKASTQPSSENIKPQSENATDFEQRIREREMQHQTDTQNLERHAMNISRSLADNRNSVNDMNSYSIMKKNVTFSMTDSQEEKETTRKKSFKRIEKNRSTFHKYSSFNKEAMSNIYENSDQENENDENIFVHNEIEKSKYPDKTCKQNVLSVLNFTFGDVGASADVKFKTEHSVVMDPASEFETHGEVHRPEDAEKSDSLEQRLTLENLQHECMADLTSQSKQLIINTSDRSLEQTTSFEYMANNVPKETMTRTEPQKLSIERSSEHLQSSKQTDADHLSIEGHFFSKSLDFNTVGSRRANFKKCDGATFSKSFDSSSDLSGSFSSQEQIQEEFRHFSLSEPVEKSVFMKPTINNADDIYKLKLDQNYVEENRQEFLGIDLTEIDKFCDIENLEILDDIDEECEELERFIDSYSDIDHTNLSLDNESDILVDDIKTEDFEAESFEVDDINTENFEAESLKHDLGNSLFEQNYAEGHISMDELLNNNYMSGDSLVKYSMTDSNDTENIIDTDKQTNKNVKIKTFHLGKNTVNMTTFGNYNCNDQAVAAKINVTVTDVDNKVHQATNSTDLTKLDKHFTVMKSIPEESAVIDESEKMKKIKELYRSLSFGEIEDLGFANNLIEAHDSQYQSYKTFSEKIDNNLTFEEIFAQNFEYLEHENNSEEDAGDQMGMGHFTDETLIEGELDKAGPAVNFVTHNCLNCGHKVTVAMHVDESYQEDHDFCVQCSPIDISVENLERRRKEKHKDNPDIY